MLNCMNTKCVVVADIEPFLDAMRTLAGGVQVHIGRLMLVTCLATTDDDETRRDTAPPDRLYFTDTSYECLRMMYANEGRTHLLSPCLTKLR